MLNSSDMLLSEYKHGTPIFHYSYNLHLILYFMETLFYSVIERTYSMNLWNYSEEGGLEI